MKGKKLLGVFLAICIFFVNPLQASAEADLGSALPLIALCDDQGELLNSTYGTPMYIDGLGTIIVTSSEFLNTENAVYAIAAFIGGDGEPVYEDLSLLAYDFNLGVAVFMTQQGSAVPITWGLESIEGVTSDTTLMQGVLYSEGEGYGFTYAENYLEGWNGQFWQLREEPEEYGLAGLPVCSADSGNIIGITVDPDPKIYMTSIDDIYNLVVEAVQGTGGSGGSGSGGSGSGGSGSGGSGSGGSGSGGAGTGTATAASSGGAGFWGLVVLGIAILLGVLVYGYVKKGKNGETEQSSESVSQAFAGEPALCGVGGVHDGAVIPLRETLIFGRDKNRCNLLFPGDSKGISSVHCQICCLNGRVELTDLGSTYGTFLSNGTKLAPHVPYGLNRGDSFYLADRQYSYRVQ